MKELLVARSTLAAVNHSFQSSLSKIVRTIIRVKLLNLQTAKSSGIKDPEEDDPRLNKFINPCTDNCIVATNDDIVSFIALLELVN